MSQKTYTSEEVRIMLLAELEASTKRFAQKLRESNRQPKKPHNPFIEYV